MKIKVILLFILFFVQSSFYAKKPDTVVIRVTPTSIDHAKLIQNALAYKTQQPLKILLDGTFRVNKTLTTVQNHTVISFINNSKIIFTDSNNSGIALANDFCTVKNGTLEGTGRSSSDFYKGYGILVYGSSHNTISNMTLKKISGHNIFFIQRKNGCKSNIIRNNRILEPAFYLGSLGDEAGILLGYSGNNYMHEDNIVEDNYIDGNNMLKIGIGIIGHGSGNIFRRNKVFNCLNYGILSYESEYTDLHLYNTQIIDNYVKNVGEIGTRTTVKGMGIYLMKSKNSKVSGNVVLNTLRNSDQTETLGPGAISISISPNTFVEKNTIDGSFMYGLVSDYSFGSFFRNNTISNTRKSGAYFINMNNAEVSGNIFKNIGATAIKGYFETTKLPYILNSKHTLNTDTYKNIDTGNNFKITGNKFYTDKDVLYFEGTAVEKTRPYGNKIKNNIIENNEVIGATKKQENLFHFRQEVSGSNKIRNNKILN